jgi:hypothetical protein
VRAGCPEWFVQSPGTDRDFGGKRFGDTGYSREELVAEPRSEFPKFV